MESEIKLTELFEKQLKKLDEKYKSLSKDMERFTKESLANPHLGIDLGDSTYKIGVAVKSKGKDKSGGLRIINRGIDSQKLIYLLTTIYHKSDIDAISKSAIKLYVKEIIDSQKDGKNGDNEEE